VYLASLGLHRSVSVSSTGCHDRDRAPTGGIGRPSYRNCWMIKLSMEYEKVRIAIAGMGLIGRRHADLVMNNPNCVLDAVIDPDEAAVGAVHSLGVKYYRTIDEYLSVGSARSNCGMIIATPNHFHFDNAMKCISAQLPILVEKPFVTVISQGKSIIRAAREAGVSVLVGHHRRYNPLLQKAQQIIETGRLGIVTVVVGLALYYKPDDYFEVAPWRREQGGGPIMINMIHEVDDLRMLLGEIEWVYAVANNRIRKHIVEDTATVMFGFSNGALGMFALSDASSSGWSWELCSGENSDYPFISDEDCYLISGTQGSLGVPTLRLRSYAQRASWNEPLLSEVIEVEKKDSLMGQLEHFCDVIRGISRPQVSAENGLRNVEIVAAIRESVESGARIDCGGGRS